MRQVALKDSKSDEYRSLLHTAVANGSANMVRLLRMFGASDTVLDENEETPRELAEQAKDEGLLMALNAEDRVCPSFEVLNMIPSCALASCDP